MSVRDQATAELMSEYMLLKELRTSKALQEAQVNMMTKDNAASTVLPGGFTLQGEWR